MTCTRLSHFSCYTVFAGGLISGRFLSGILLACFGHLEYAPHQWLIGARWAITFVGVLRYRGDTTSQQRWPKCRTCFVQNPRLFLVFRSSLSPH